MMLQKLIDALAGLRHVIAASGSKKVSDGLKPLEELLQAQKSGDVASALHELRETLSRDKARTLQLYVERLNQSGIDADAFARVAADLRADKFVDKEDADEIAHRYTGGRKKWPTRAAALKAIQKKFDERVYQASKMEIVKQYRVS